MEPDRRGLQTLFAFAYGMQVGRMRRIAAELQKLAQQAQLATMASGAAIAIAAQNQIECIARSGGAAPQLGSKPEATVGLSGECIRTGIPQFCADTETHPFVDRMHSRTFGVRSIVYVPLFRGVQPAGVIGVFSDKPGHFTQHDLRVLQLIGREVTKSLKWEPNPNMNFAPVSTPGVSEPNAMAAGVVLEAEPVQKPTTVTAQTESSDQVSELRDEEHTVLLAAAERIIAADKSAKEDAPLESAATEAATEPVVEYVPEENPEVQTADNEAAIAEDLPLLMPAPLLPESNRREWADPEDMEYPASVPSFLFLHEKRIPRWALLSGAVALLAILVWAGVRIAPRWFTKEEPSQMVYGPPQVTTETGAPVQSADQSQAEPSVTAPLATVPGVPTTSKPEQTIAKSVGPATYVKTVKTQITGNHTFISIYLSGPAQFQAHELTKPDRIYIDLHGVEVSPDLKNVKIAGVGPVADFRFSKSENNVARLVMVLDAPCTYLVSVTSDPYVIVLDVQPLRIPHPGAAKRNPPSIHPGL